MIAGLFLGTVLELGFVTGMVLTNGREAREAVFWSLVFYGIFALIHLRFLFK